MTLSRGKWVWHDSTDLSSTAAGLLGIQLPDFIKASIGLSQGPTELMMFPCLMRLITPLIWPDKTQLDGLYEDTTSLPLMADQEMDKDYLAFWTTETRMQADGLVSDQLVARTSSLFHSI